MTIEDEPTDDDFKTGGLLDDDDDRKTTARAQVGVILAACY